MSHTSFLYTREEIFVFVIFFLIDRVGGPDADDDTTLHFIGNNVDKVVDDLNRALSEISHWCRNNKLTNHAGKSEAMIISHRAFYGPLRPLKLGDKILNVVHETRCLGVITDPQLSWNSHSEHLCKSFGKKVRQLKRFKYLPKSKLETIYFSSIVPSISYCSSVWGTSTPPLMNDLEHIHARAAIPSTDYHGTYQIKMP